MIGIERNILKVEELSVLDLAEKYGTPAYIISKNKVKQNLNGYQESLKKYYPASSLVLYASKALSAKFMYRICQECGSGADVVSGGEIFTASASGFDMENTYFHGSNKTADEIKLAIEKNVGYFVIDGFDDAKRINQIAGELDITVNALIRIKPNVDAHTHEAIQTGQLDSKFGFALETGEAERFISKLCEYPNINLVGLHCHIGSQILDVEPFLLTANKIISFAGLINKKCGFNLQQLNLGGGLGVKYTEEDIVPSKDEFIKSLANEVIKTCEENDLPLPKLLIEPGRSIVADAGMTVYTVGNIKDIEGVRKYVSVDGSMADNPRYSLYEALYTITRVENPEQSEKEKITIAGKACESGDILQKDAELPPLKTGDHIAFLGTGAYNYSMASNYNRATKPPIILVDGNESQIVVKKESYEDMIRLDV